MSPGKTLFVAAGPGSGKTAFAQNAARRLSEELLSRGDLSDAQHALFENTYAVNITFGGGTPLTALEKEMPASRALALRTLWHAFFRSHERYASYDAFMTDYKNSGVTFDSAVGAIYEASGSKPMFLTVVLDEAHLVVDPDHKQ